MARNSDLADFGKSAAAGAVLQLVQSSKNDTDDHNSTTWTNIAGTDQSGTGSIFCVKITPIQASSKILFSAHIMVGGKAGNAGPKIKLLRASTDIAVGVSSNDTVPGTFGNHFITTELDCEQMSMSYLDSPSYSLGDEITYKPQIRSEDSAYYTYINRAHTDNNSAVNGLRLFSNLIVMEIAG